MNAINEDPPPTRPYKPIALVAVILIAGLVALFMLGRGNGLTALEAYEKELQARGVTTHPRELIDLDVPDEENSGPLWNLVSEFPTINMDWTLIDDLRKTPPELPEEKISDLLDTLDKSQPILDLLREAANRPYLTFVAQDFTKPIVEWNPIRCGGVHPAHQLLFTAAAYCATTGDTQKALDHWKLGIQSSLHFTRTRFTAGSLFQGLPIMDSALTTGEVVFDSDQFAMGDLMSVMEHLQEIRIHELVGPAMELQRTFGFQNFKVAYETRDFDNYSFFGRKGKFRYVPDRFEGALLPFMWGVIFNKFAREHEVELQTIKVLKTHPSTWRNKLNRLRTRTTMGRWREKSIPSMRSFAVSDEFVVRVLRTSTRHSMFYLSLACRAYRKEHGDWPENLQALVPDYVDELPEDLFTGDDFKYRLDPEVLLYSVGPDGKDDEGSGDDLAWSSDRSRGSSGE